MRFEWDEHKNAVNRRKHGLDFSDIERLTDAIIQADETREEERWKLIGLIGSAVVLGIITFPSEEVIRVISLRKATRHEQDTYFAQIFGG